MNKTHARVCHALTFAAIGLFAFPGFANATLTSHVVTQGQTASNSVANGSVSASNTTSNMYSQATGRAYTAYGVNKAYTSGSASGPQGYAYSNSSSHWGDTITFHNDALTGQTGQVTLNFQYDYGFSNFSDSIGKAADTRFTFEVSALSSHWTAQLYQNRFFHQQINSAGTIGGGMHGSRSDLTGVTLGTTPGVAELVIDFIWGTHFSISTVLGVEGSTPPHSFLPNEGSASYTANAFNSAYWAGFTNLTTGGMAVADYQVTSQSGTDYSRSFVPAAEVPEPGSFALLGIAVAGLAFSRRRKA